MEKHKGDHSSWVEAWENGVELTDNPPSIEKMWCARLEALAKKEDSVLGRAASQMAKDLYTEIYTNAKRVLEEEMPHPPKADIEKMTQGLVGKRVNELELVRCHDREARELATYLELAAEWG